MADLVARIRNPSKPRPAYDLNEQDFRHLELLRNKREYAVYLKALDGAINLQGDALLASQDSYHDTLHKGILIGLRKAGTLVDEILQQRHHAHEQQRRRDESFDRTPDRLQRTAALYGSPAFGRTTTR